MRVSVCVCVGGGRGEVGGQKQLRQRKTPKALPKSAGWCEDNKYLIEKKRKRKKKRKERKKKENICQVSISFLVVCFL